MLTVFKIFSLLEKNLESTRNLQQNYGNFHHSLDVFLHYLAKLKCLFIFFTKIVEIAQLIL